MVLVLSHLAEVDTKFYEAVTVTPFVVVPSDNLDKCAVDNVGEFEVYNRGVTIAAVIN